MSAYRTAPYRDPHGLRFHGHCWEKGYYPLYEFPSDDSLVLSHEVDDWAPPKFIIDGVRAPLPLFMAVHPGENIPRPPAKTPGERLAYLIKDYQQIQKVVRYALQGLDALGRRHRGHLTVGFYEGGDDLPGLAWSREPLVPDAATKERFPEWWYPREKWLLAEP